MTKEAHVDGYRQPPMERAGSVRQGVARLLDGGGHLEPMLCTSGEELGDPDLEKLALGVRWVSAASYSRAKWWGGGTVLAVELSPDQMALVCADPRVERVIVVEGGAPCPGAPAQVPTSPAS